LFRHVRRLGEQERCPGYRFPQAGESLRGAEWALDQAARALEIARLRLDALASKPLLDGVAPFSALYDDVWDQSVLSAEDACARATRDLDELTARLEEWRSVPPFLAPTPIHRRSLWRCKAGTSVPLCYSSALRRPAGEPILVPAMDGVDCPRCLDFYT